MYVIPTRSHAPCLNVTIVISELLLSTSTRHPRGYGQSIVRLSLYIGLARSQILILNRVTGLVSENGVKFIEASSTVSYHSKQKEWTTPFHLSISRLVGHWTLRIHSNARMWIVRHFFNEGLCIFIYRFYLHRPHASSLWAGTSCREQ